MASGYIYPMILIADSGSTKCDWIWGTDSESIFKAQTAGINPYILSDSQIWDVLNTSQALKDISAKIMKVYFYGAGCSSETKCQLVSKVLQNFFAQAEIHVEHDLKGAALAVCGDEKGIVCILGTGSNSCFFDGTSIVDRLPSLGYILGDEGAGVWLGKKLVTDLLYRRLPSELERELNEAYPIQTAEVLDRIYKQPQPNTFLASFAKFVIEHREHSYCRDLLLKGFEEFIGIHVNCYRDLAEFPVHFIGSIASLGRSTLEPILHREGFHAGNFIEKPVLPLAHYHFKKAVT